VVIGVHSPKFTTEEDTESVRQAVARYGITHPVLVDSERRVWDAYGVRGWPTMVLIDPRGYVLGMVSGEGHGPALDQAIGEALRLLGEQQLLDDQLLPLRLEVDSGAISPASQLLYPGKVLADADGNALYIADSGHHRLVMARLDGSGYETIGSGEPGHEDGDFETTNFHSPQGMALDAAHGWLYLADTGNHLIRRVDLRARTVTTVAGTGAQGWRQRGGGPARETPLNSPWDVLLLDGNLYIAMAGTHQLWAYDPIRDTVSVWAGTGAEARHDGPASQATFAQPSGLATDGTRIFVADSEASSIRILEPSAAGGEPLVRTLAGGDLFAFGDKDGRGDLARLQHPLGVAWVPDDTPIGVIYVADTYNHKIRRLDPHTRDLSSFAGSGQPGGDDGVGAAARFSEPGGLSYTAGNLYVADTNNHAIRIVALADRTVTTLQIAGLCAPGICLPG
jgi:DNA-binding beta-propeller fold protein YncE